MKSFTIICFFTAFTAFFGHAQGIPQPTHTVTQFSDGSTSPLQLSDEGYYYYNNDGYLYQSKSNVWDGVSWVLDSRSYYTLAPDGQPLEILGKSWDQANGILVNSYKITTAYHTDGQVSMRKSEFWNASNSSWQLSDLTTYSFSPSNKVTEYKFQFYLDNVPEFGQRKLYTYDGSDRVSVETRQEWNNASWENYTITDYLYNGTDLDFNQAFVRDWDAFQQTWGIPDVKRTQIVSATQRTVLTELLNGANWNPSTRTVVDYDGNGQVLSDRFDSYDESTSTWTTENNLEFSYNVDQSPKQLRYFSTDFTTDDFYLSFLTDYDYGVYAVSTQNPGLQAQVKLWPNPTSDYVQVKVEGNEDAKLTLMDMHGKVVSQVHTSSQNANLSLIGNPAGAYMLKIEQGNAYKIVPVVKH